MIPKPVEAVGPELWIVPRRQFGDQHQAANHGAGLRLRPVEAFEHPDSFLWAIIRRIGECTEPRGAVVGGESVAIGEVCWMPLLPPEKPGLYAIRFFATLDSGARLEARGLLTVIEDKARR
jgi:hypothetical protein